MITSDLDYIIEQYRILHKNNIYGISSIYLLNPIKNFIDEIKPKRVLDYGCGQSSLIDVLKREYPKIEFEKYDPAIEEYSEEPNGKYDFVICTDVLEHIPEEYLDEIIINIKNISDKIFFNISTKIAIWTLPDGTNCHKTVKDSSWWFEKISKYFVKLNECYDKKFMYALRTW
jgi:hypothetical protein